MRDYNGNMAQVSVLLPVDLQSYVDARVAAGGYADPADFLRDLIRRDQDDYRADVARVQQLIDEGIASGIVDAEPEDLLRELVAETRTRHG
jgi:putative addiction module CopG family antidote